MPFERKKRYLIITLAILGILCCVFGCVVITNRYIAASKKYDQHYPSEKLPIRDLSAQINEEQREELFAQLRKMSEKHNLDFHLTFYENQKIFFVEMYGKRLEILALSQPINTTTTELDFSFYEKDPANPPAQETVDELYDGLKSMISEIPSVKIIEEK
jgi:hypothetical protein